MIRRGITNLRYSCYSLVSNRLSTRLVFSARCCSNKDNDRTSVGNAKSNERETTSPFSTLEKYKIFKDEDSPVIFDIVEERFKTLQYDPETQDGYQGLNLERGKDGVFDIEHLVDLLQQEQAQHIFVLKIPEEVRYVNYLVIVSGKSVRHMIALAEFVKLVYKKKRNDSDRIPKVEGEDSSHWIAMDLGNIALHIFSATARKTYDLESLWSVGAEYDELSRKPEDPVLEILQKHSVYLRDLEPANSGE
ncbi:Uncharacterized protein GBIM_06885 [Gryllus bimaculatus]|nr:Uncharacterized protein GBIM_06885 [Gryllus bimaculatus]